MGTEGGMVVAYQGWHKHRETVQEGTLRNLRTLTTRQKESWLLMKCITNEP